MLLFKKKFLDKIRRGEKTQTIRLWKYRKMRAGQRSFIPGIGYISVESVAPVEIEKLTDGDALPDGFESAALLKQELQLLYAKEIKNGFSAYRICFSVFPAEMQEQIREEKHLQKELQKTAAAFSNFRRNENRSAEYTAATLAKLQLLAIEETEYYFSGKTSGKAG
ncbi:hypothetical protein FACS189427_01210 [Planctomycetales bacterium]|nr:hypothetical protein FACS189427_01210 [Planctomycetales bacterium]